MAIFGNVEGGGGFLRLVFFETQRDAECLRGWFVRNW